AQGRDQGGGQHQPGRGRHLAAGGQRRTAGDVAHPVGGAAHRVEQGGDAGGGGRVLGEGHEREHVAAHEQQRGQPPERDEPDRGQPPAQQGPLAAPGGAGQQVQQGDDQDRQFGGGVGAAAQQERRGRQQRRAPGVGAGPGAVHQGQQHPGQQHGRLEFGGVVRQQGQGARRQRERDARDDLGGQRADAQGAGHGDGSG